MAHTHIHINTNFAASNPRALHPANLLARCQIYSCRRPGKERSHLCQHSNARDLRSCSACHPDVTGGSSTAAAAAGLMLLDRVSLSELRYLAPRPLTFFSSLVPRLIRDNSRSVRSATAVRAPPCSLVAPCFPSVARWLLFSPPNSLLRLPSPP